MPGYYVVLLIALAVSPPGLDAAERPGPGGLGQQLMLLDTISYHPSLLPLVLQNTDYLELTPGQVQRLRDWRRERAPAMLEKMREIARGRIEFIELSLNPQSKQAELEALQQSLFRLQEEVLSYKLECRQQILRTFTADQWDALRLLYSDRQMAVLDQ